MNTASFSGACGQCGSSLGRALVREVRHYEETGLMRVTCVACEESFFAVATDSPDSISVEDVVVAARALAQARSLSQLFDLG